MGTTITVFAGSSDVVPAPFLEAGHSLGALLAQRGHTMVYGGGNIGLMGALVRAAKGGGAHTIGVIPESLNRPPIVYDNCDELIVTADMRHRKTIMEEKGEAFIALPGGFGTIEEFMELLTLKQLHYHNKAIALLNTQGYYDPLLQMFETVYENHFAKQGSRNIYFVSKYPSEILDYIESYKPEDVVTKWY